MQQNIDSSFTHLKRHLYQQNLTILGGGVVVLILCGLLLLGLQHVLGQEKSNLRADFATHVNYLRKQEQLLLQFNHQNARVWSLLQHESNLPNIKPQFLEYAEFKVGEQFDWRIPSKLPVSQHATYQTFSQYLADFYLSFWLNTVLPASPLVMLSGDEMPIFAIPAGQQITPLDWANLTAQNEVMWQKVPNAPNQVLGIINAGLPHKWYLVSIFKRSILSSANIPLILKHKFWLKVSGELVMGNLDEVHILSSLDLNFNQLRFTKYGLGLCLQDQQYEACYLIGYHDFFGDNLWLLGSGLLVLLLFFGAIFYYRHWLANNVIGRAQDNQQALIAAKQAADAANFAKSQFLAAMSHEIRTPLYGVISGLELLERSNLNHNQQNQIARMQKAAQILHTQLTNILDLSKIEQGLMQLEITTFNLPNLAQDCIAAFSALALQQQISLVSEIDVSLPQMVQGDSGKLRQIISNLLSNALKFTKAKGEVILRVKLLHKDASNCRVFFSVSDNGAGITAAKLDTLFTPITSSSGAGLGLAICQQLAQIMSSKIAVSSELGQGSNFSFTLDFALSEENAKSPINPQAKQAFMPLNLHILVVEDNPINCATLNEQLAELGCSAEFASDAENALQLWQAQSFAALITDVNLPGVSGLALAAKIRDLSANTAIIGLSANNLPDAKSIGLQNGMNAYCVKPISLKDLYWQLVLATKIVQKVPPNLKEVFVQTMTADLAELDAAIAAKTKEQSKQLLHRISGALAVANNPYLADCLQDLQHNFALQKWANLRFLLTLLINL